MKWFKNWRYFCATFLLQCGSLCWLCLCSSCSSNHCVTVFKTQSSRCEQRKWQRWVECWSHLWHEHTLTKAPGSAVGSCSSPVAVCPMTFTDAPHVKMTRQEALSLVLFVGLLPKLMSCHLQWYILIFYCKLLPFQFKTMIKLCFLLPFQAEQELRMTQSEFDRQAEITRLLLEGVGSTHVCSVYTGTFKKFLLLCALISPCAGTSPPLPKWLCGGSDYVLRSVLSVHGGSSKAAGQVQIKPGKVMPLNHLFCLCAWSNTALTT